MLDPPFHTLSHSGPSSFRSFWGQPQTKLVPACSECTNSKFIGLVGVDSKQLISSDDTASHLRPPKIPVSLCPTPTLRIQSHFGANSCVPTTDGMVLADGTSDSVVLCFSSRRTLLQLLAPFL